MVLMWYKTNMNEVDTNTILKPLNGGSLEYVGIFGSRARGNARQDSDLDILVRFTEPQGLLRLANMRRQISKDLGVEVDLVTEGSLSPFIRDEIISDLKTIYGKR